MYECEREGVGNNIIYNIRMERGRSDGEKMSRDGGEEIIRF